MVKSSLCIPVLYIVGCWWGSWLACLINTAHAFAVPARRIYHRERSHRYQPIAIPSTSGSVEGCISGWVIENLDDGGTNSSSITSRSVIRAGENDTLPLKGLLIGSVRILAADSFSQGDEAQSDETPNSSAKNSGTIRLLVGRNGWGTGVHPTTRLCVEWICDTIVGGEIVMDYGCGSGILSLTALHMGASKCVGVDVEAEALVTAVRNLKLNGYEPTERFEAYHTREILPYGIASAMGGVDVCVANILVGQLVRPSMVAALVTNIAQGGLLCLSGIRPGEQADSLRDAYNAHMDWIDYAELAAMETEHSVESYGFDCGVWCRLVGRKRMSSRFDDVASMSEQAVS